MKKKILIGVGIFIFIVIVGMIYMNYRNRTLSPPGNTEFNQDGLSISVTYSRPSKKERLIFGEEGQEVLLPYGKYWRLGANESTEISFGRDVTFNGEPVSAGTYRMYAVPYAGEFEVTLNTELNTWGYMEPDYSMDVLKTKIPVERTMDIVEQFTIRIEQNNAGALVICEWDDTKIKIPVE